MKALIGFIVVALMVLVAGCSNLVDAPPPEAEATKSPRMIIEKVEVPDQEPEVVLQKSPRMIIE